MTNKNTYLSMRDMHMNAGTTKMYRLAQSGRSMVEMLGVLAIVGVLSIGGIMGYDYAVAKFRANTIMSELNLRAVPISQQLTQHLEEANTALTLEAGDTLSSGQSVSANVAINPEYFEFHLTEVDDTTCELVLENYETPAWMMVNGNLYENSTDICSNPDNDMTFVYKNDLGERRNCSSKGFFNLETYKCDCAGGTYFNKDSKDCTCPAGHIWSEVERKCIESRCAPGEFEALDGGCVSCDDTSSYKINKEDENAVALCNACSNRYITSHQGTQICAYKKCEKTISFPSPEGICLDCTGETISYIASSSEYGQEYCNACPNRHYNAGKCTKNITCEDGKTFIDNQGTCIDCSITTPVKIGVKEETHQNEINACLACKNKSGQANRTVSDKDGYYTECIKTVCEEGEFMGADGVCYSCNHVSTISVNENSGCTHTKCGRIENQIDNVRYCAPGTCDTTTGKNVLLSDGSCYPCNTKTVFKATQDECDACGKREDGELQRAMIDNGWCRLNSCTYGESYPLSNGRGSDLCYNCEGYYEGNGACGNSDFGVSYCEACGNYVADGRCYTPTSCNKGSEFRANKLYYFCTACDYSDKIDIGTHSKHREMCTSCVTTPRFFAENYCYRCDSNEAPTASTQEEKDSCTKCPNRQVDTNNQCVLIQTEN